MLTSNLRLDEVVRPNTARLTSGQTLQVMKALSGDFSRVGPSFGRMAGGNSWLSPPSVPSLKTLYQEMTMATRREFVKSLPAFAVAAQLGQESGPAHAAAAAPVQGHFHPKGKAPSEFTKEVLRKAKASLPFADTRDFEEQKRGLIAPMTELKIPNDAGGVAWDMTQFQFLDGQDEFDSVHPSMHRIGKLNNNYGLYEVVPGIYQVRGFDLAQTTFVRGKTGWIIFDCLVTADVMRAAWKLFQEHRGEGLPVTAVVYSHSHGDHWGGVRGVVDEADVRAGKVQILAPRDFMDFTISENVYAGNAMNRRLFYQYGVLLPVNPYGYVTQGLGHGISTGHVGPDRADADRREGHRGDRGRRRADDLPEHAEHRGALGDEHLHPREEGALDRRECQRHAAQHLHAPRGARPRLR